MRWWMSRRSVRVEKRQPELSCISPCFTCVYRCFLEFASLSGVVYSLSVHPWLLMSEIPSWLLASVQLIMLNGRII